MYLKIIFRNFKFKNDKKKNPCFFKQLSKTIIFLCKSLDYVWLSRNIRESMREKKSERKKRFKINKLFLGKLNNFKIHKFSIFLIFSIIQLNMRKSFFFTIFFLCLVFYGNRTQP